MTKEIRKVVDGHTFSKILVTQNVVCEFEEFLFIDGLLPKEHKVFGIMDIVREEFLELDLLTYYETLSLALTLHKQDEDKQEFFKGILCQMIESYFDEANGKDTAPLEFMFELVERMKEIEGTISEPQPIVKGFTEHILNGFNITTLSMMTIDNVRQTVGNAYEELSIRDNRKVSKSNVKAFSEDVVIYIAYELSKKEVH